MKATDTAGTGRHALRVLACVLALLACAVAAPVVHAQPQQAPQTRIGYVDLKRLVDNAPQMVAGNARLQAEFADRDRQLKADEARLAQLRARDDGSVTGEAQRALAREVDALDRRIRRTRESLREELRRRSEEETERSWQAINEAVAAYAREQAYDLIVSSPVFYASPSIDITDQVLARLRRQAEGGDGD
jgi:outer membrane protein